MTPPNYTSVLDQGSYWSAGPRVRPKTSGLPYGGGSVASASSSTRRDSASSLASIRPPGTFMPPFPRQGKPSLGSNEHLEALLQTLMQEDKNTKDSESPCLEKLLSMMPSNVGAKKTWTDQVVDALRRPSQESPVIPVGMVLQSTPSSAQVQRQTNAKIIAWVLRHNAVFELSQMEHGCWIVQQALEVVDFSVSKVEPLHRLCGGADAKSLLAGGFKSHVNEALLDKHANYVLQKCIEVLPRESTEFILDEISQHPGGAVFAARSRSGCRVLQRLIEHFWDARTESPGLKKIVFQLIEEDERHVDRRPATSTTYDPTTSSSRRLVNDQFANFVFRSLVEHHAWVDDVVKRVLVRDVHSLAQSFYASHLLSFLLTSAPGEYQTHQRRIIEALKGSGDGSPESEWKREEFRKLEKNKMGSFVFKQVNQLSPDPPSTKGAKKGKDVSLASQKGARKGVSPRER